MTSIAPRCARVDRAFDFSTRKKHVGGKVEETDDRRRTVYAQKPSYVTLANLDGLTVDNLRVLIPDEVFARHQRSALSLHSVSKATLNDIRREPAGADSSVPVVLMENCRNALLTGCLALPNTGIFLGLAGKETANISILSDSGILIQGMTNGRVEDVSLRNITMRIDRAADYAKRKKHVGGKTEKTEDRRETIFARKPSYVTLANIDGLTVSGLRVLIPDEVFVQYNRSALSLHSVSKSSLTDIRREPGGASSEVPVVMMQDVPAKAARD